MLKWWLRALIGIALASGLVFWRSHQLSKPPLQLSYWYWQTPYRLSPSDLNGLHALGVQRMFVRAGTFSSDGRNIVLTIPQSYTESTGAIPVHLVFNADYGVVRHFEEFDLKVISNQIVSRILAQVDKALKLHIKVTGVQLDVDCPTRLLPRYAELVARIRASTSRLKKGGGLEFSVTGLTSWLGSRTLSRLAQEVDFLVPQAYEGVTGMTIADARPVFDPAELKRALRLGEGLPCPFWIGIPAYGHAMLYDDKGNLIGTYRNLEAQDALRHPSFKLDSAKVVGGEQILNFVATKPASDGRGKGYRLVYSLPSAQLIQEAMRIVKEERGANCHGAILYRMAEQGSSFTVPLDTVILALHEKSTAPKLKAQLRVMRNATGLLEGASTNIPADAYVEIENVGTASTSVGPYAAEVDVRFDQVGIEDVRLRDFNSVQFLNGDHPAPSLRAQRLRIGKNFLCPGEKASVGPIRLLFSGPVHATIVTRAHSLTGVTTTETTFAERAAQSG